MAEAFDKAIPTPLRQPRDRAGRRGRLADLALEDDAHVLGVLEPGERADLLERQVGLGQELADPLDLGLADQPHRREADVLAEPPLEDAPRERDAREQVVDGHPLAGVLADQLDGQGDLRVVDGRDVGRLPGGDPQRLDDLDARGRVGAGHEGVEQLGREVADPLGVGDDARERRVAELAEHLVVVDAEDGDLLGHGQADPRRRR